MHSLRLPVEQRLKYKIVQVLLERLQPHCRDCQRPSSQADGELLVAYERCCLVEPEEYS